MSRAHRRVRPVPARLVPGLALGAVVAAGALLLGAAPAHADTTTPTDPPPTAPPTTAPPTPPPTAPPTVPPPTASPPTTAPPTATAPGRLPTIAVMRPPQDRLSRVGGFAFTVFNRMTRTQYEKVSLPVSVPTTGLIRTDCSGFTNYLLQKVSPRAYASLVRVGGTTRPISATYAFVMPRSPAGWQSVHRIGALRNGDVVAWPQPRGKSAGHVMVVADRARFLGGRSWLVPIMDSTTQSHGRFDSRGRDPRALRNSSGRVGGVGTGYLLLVTDARGRPVQYGWNPWAAERVQPTVISLGRPLG